MSSRFVVQHAARVESVLPAAVAVLVAAVTAASPPAGVGGWLFRLIVVALYVSWARCLWRRTS